MVTERREPPQDGSLLLVTHVGLKCDGDRILIDDQTAAGIARWRAHFDRVTYVGVEASADQESFGVTHWTDVPDTPDAAPCRLVPLPNGYRLRAMARHYREVRTFLAGAIAGHAHLCFTLGGLVGDWPAVAALEAIRQKRRFAAWFDRVEPDVIARTLDGAPLRRRIKEAIALPLMERYHRHLLRHSSVALLQGGDTLAHYGRWSSNPHCIYDTHTGPQDAISAQDLAAKLERLAAGAPLRIVYVGRAAAMKGPLDWIETLGRLHDAGTPFAASWLGDGPALDDMRRLAASRGIADRVDFRGFVADREAVLAAMRDADILMFCHKTAESPRCLIEALVSGSAIVGYESDYVRELARTGGGLFVPRDDVASLARAVEGLSGDRPALVDLVRNAAATGRRFDEASVYAHRAGLMRTYG